MKSVYSSKIIRCAFSLLLVLAISREACARSWEALYSFGDSYTDSGAGRVDGNGPTWVVYLAAELGIPFTYAGDPKAQRESLNFAVSGAETGWAVGWRSRPLTAACGSEESVFGRGMENQVLDFKGQVDARTLAFNPQKTLFFLAGGLNDGSFSTSTTIENIEREVRLLYALGGRYFVVALLPTKIPAFSAQGSRLNPALARIPDDLRSDLPGAHIEVSHWGNYFDQIMERPRDYGIVNTKDRCAGRALLGEDPTPCAAPDEYFYYYDGHPSTAVQRVVASELKHELDKLFAQ